MINMNHFGLRLLLLAVAVLASHGVDTRPEEADVSHTEKASKYETLQDVLPLVTFKCKRRTPGYYADPRFECEVFHYCHADGSRVTILCARSSPVEQLHRICKFRDVISKECGRNEIFLQLADDLDDEELSDTTDSTLGKATDFKLPKVIVRPTDSAEVKPPTTPLTPSQVSRQEKISFRSFAVTDSSKKLVSMDSQEKTLDNVYGISAQVNSEADGRKTPAKPEENLEALDAKVKFFPTDGKKQKKYSLSPASYSRGFRKQHEREYESLELPITSTKKVQILKSIPPLKKASKTKERNVSNLPPLRDVFFLPNDDSKSLADKILYLLEVYNKNLTDAHEEDYSPYKGKTKPKLAVSSIISERKILVNGEPKTRRKRMVVQEVNARRPYAVFYAKVPDSSYESNGPPPPPHHRVSSDSRGPPPRRLSQPQPSPQKQKAQNQQQSTLQLSLDPSVVPLDVPTIPIAIRIPKKKKKQQRKNNPANRPEPQVVYENPEQAKKHHEEQGIIGNPDMSEQQNVYYYAPPGHEMISHNQRNPTVPILVRDTRGRIKPNHRPNGNPRSPNQPAVLSRPLLQPATNKDIIPPRAHHQSVPSGYQAGTSIPGQQRQNTPQVANSSPVGGGTRNGSPQNYAANVPAQPSFFLDSPDFLDRGFQSLGSPFNLSPGFSGPSLQGGPRQQATQSQGQAPVPQGPPASSGQSARTPASAQVNTRGVPAAQQSSGSTRSNLPSSQSVLSPPPAFSLAPNGFPSSFFDDFPSIPEFGLPFLQQNFQSPPSSAYSSQERPQADVTGTSQRDPQTPLQGGVSHREPYGPQSYAPNSAAVAPSPANERRPTRRPNPPSTPSSTRYHVPQPPPPPPQSIDSRPYVAPQQPSSYSQSQYRPVDRPHGQAPPSQPAVQDSRPPVQRNPEPQNIAIHSSRPLPQKETSPSRETSSYNGRPQVPSTGGVPNEYYMSHIRPVSGQVSSHHSYLSAPTSPRPQVVQSQREPSSEEQLRRRRPSTRTRGESSTRSPSAAVSSRYRQEFDFVPIVGRPTRFQNGDGNGYSSTGSRSPYNRGTPATHVDRDTRHPSRGISYEDIENTRHTTEAYPTRKPEEREKYHVVKEDIRRPTSHRETRPQPPRDYYSPNFDDSRGRDRLITDNYVDVITLANSHTPRPRPTTAKPRVRIVDNRYRYSTPSPLVEELFYPLRTEEDPGESYYTTKSSATEPPPVHRGTEDDVDLYSYRTNKQRDSRTRSGVRGQSDSQPSRVTGERDRNIRHRNINHEDRDSLRPGQRDRNTRPQSGRTRDSQRNRHVHDDETYHRYREEDETPGRDRYVSSTVPGDNRNRYRTNSDRYNDPAIIGNIGDYIKQNGESLYPGTTESDENAGRYIIEENEEVSTSGYSSNKPRTNRVRTASVRETDDRRNYSGERINRNKPRDHRIEYPVTESVPEYDERRRGHGTDGKYRDTRNKAHKEGNNRYEYQEIAETTPKPTTPKPPPKRKPLPPRPTFPPFPTFPPPPPPPPPRKEASTTTETPEQKASTTELPTTNDIEVEPPLHSRRRLNTRPRVYATVPPTEYSTHHKIFDDDDQDYAATTLAPTRRPRKRTRVRQRRPRPTTTEQPADVNPEESISSYVDKQKTETKFARNSYLNRRVSTTAEPRSSTEPDTTTPATSHSEEFGNRIKLFGRPRTRKPALFTAKPTTTAEPTTEAAQSYTTTHQPRRKSTKRARRPYKKRKLRQRTTTSSPTSETTTDYVENIARSDEDSQALWYSSADYSQSTTGPLVQADSLFSEVSTEPYNEFLMTTTSTEVPYSEEINTEATEAMDEPTERVDLERHPKPVASRKRLLNFGKPRLKPASS